MQAAAPESMNYQIWKTQIINNINELKGNTHSLPFDRTIRLYKEAKELVLNKKFEKAIKVLQELIDHDQKSIQALNLLAYSIKTQYLQKHADNEFQNNDEQTQECISLLQRALAVNQSLFN